MSDYEQDLQERRDKAMRTLAAHLKRNGATDRTMAALVLLHDTPPELMGPAEVASCLGVARSNLGAVKNLPGPVCAVSNGAIPIRVAEHVRRFADERGTRHEGGRA